MAVLDPDGGLGFLDRGTTTAVFSLVVQPPLLSGAAARQQQAAHRLGALAGELAAAGHAAAAAAGEPGLASAISGRCGDGAAAVGVMNVAVGGLAASLEGAAALYTSTDESAMPGG